MAAPSLNFPAPETTDQKAVASALEAGGVEWRRGDFREAVRWLHRAADAAQASGDERRGVGLARVAAQLMAQLEMPPESSPRDDVSALASFDDFNDQTIVDAPVLTTRTAQQSGVGLVDSEPAAAPKPEPPRPNRPPKPPTASNPTGSMSPLSLKSSPVNPKSAPLHSSPRASVRERRALRVAVLNESKGRRLVAELLEEGQALPAGASEALLVFTDPDASLSV